MIAAKIASEENEIKELDRQMKQDIHSAFQFGECIVRIFRLRQNQTTTVFNLHLSNREMKISMKKTLH